MVIYINIDTLLMFQSGLRSLGESGFWLQLDEKFHPSIQRVRGEGGRGARTNPSRHVDIVFLMIHYFKFSWFLVGVWQPSSLELTGKKGSCFYSCFVQYGPNVTHLIGATTCHLLAGGKTVVWLINQFGLHSGRMYSWATWQHYCLLLM